MNGGTVQDISIKKIRSDGGTQTRAGLNQETIDEYAAAYKANAPMPPIVVFRDESGAYWLADGFHRYYAQKANGGKTAEAEVRIGTQRDALLYAIGANQAHGLKRTNEDKRKSVTALLKDAEWGTWTDGRIAEHAGVTQPFVGKLRDELTHNGYEFPDQRKALRDGKEVTVTTKSGRKEKPAKPPAREPTRVLRDRSTDAPEDEPVRQIDETPADEREAFIHDKTATEPPEDAGCGPCDEGEEHDHVLAPAVRAPARVTVKCPTCGTYTDNLAAITAHEKREAERRTTEDAA